MLWSCQSIYFAYGIGIFGWMKRWLYFLDFATSASAMLANSNSGTEQRFVTFHIWLQPLKWEINNTGDQAGYDQWGRHDCIMIFFAVEPDENFLFETKIHAVVWKVLQAKQLFEEFLGLSNFGSCYNRKLANHCGTKKSQVCHQILKSESDFVETIMYDYTFINYILVIC